MSNIVVIGESCIDEYVYGTCDRVCPEAAALCFRHSNYKTVNSGMAGNTYENLKALNDNDQHKIDLITCRSTIIKRRFIDKKYNSIIFREDINDKSDKINLTNYNSLKDYDYIVISDYNKGFLSIDDIKQISAIKRSDCLIFIDTKKSLKDLSKFVDFIKINSPEFEQNAQYIDEIIKYSNLIVTKGEKGATFYSKNEIKDFATEKVILRDVCGAGDTFLAGLVIKYSETKDINESIKYANACACKVVAKFGVVTV
jgi:D-beta-D-heptose 7-phosphate kinase/D-beta-D-heptose 1-phosphate adenosyltransferase